MIEVFRTNVSNSRHASQILHHIHDSFATHRANFDLEDCDRVLRVVCPNGLVDVEGVVDILRQFGFEAEVLPDTLVA